MSTSDDDDESGISSTGISTNVLAILLSVAIVITVITVKGVSMYTIQLYIH